MNITAIRQGLAAAVLNVTGIVQSFALMPDSINPPTFAVIDYDLDYHVSMSTAGLKALQFTCMLWTSAGDTATGRQTLDDFLNNAGAGSVFAAIEADKTLGGTCSSLVVDGVNGAGRLFAIGDVDEQYVGAQINVRVWAT